MKVASFLVLIFLSINGLSQNVVNGKVIDRSSTPLPGAKIEEVGTSNHTTSDFDGLFKIETLTRSSEISVNYIGHDSQTILIESDTVLTVQLLEYSYDTRWLTFGGNLEFINSVFGLQISNGLDEVPLIHFEDFQDELLVKVFGQTDFRDDYNYGFDVGLYWLGSVGRTTLGFSSSNYTDSEIKQTDINLSSLIRHIRNTGLIFRTGYQYLNGSNNFGLGIGIEQGGKGFYFGLNSRYFFDYFHHQAYLQFKLPIKYFISFRTSYDQIDGKSLLSIGLNYSFVRNNNR